MTDSRMKNKIGRWKRYPKYRDSGVDWLGEIPEGWELCRLKHIASVNDDTLGEATDPEYEILYVDISNVDEIEGIKNKEEMNFKNAPSRARRKVKDGDIIISTVRTYLRAIAPMFDPESNLIVSTGFAVIRPKNEFESKFAAYALRAPYFVEEVVANSVGVSYPAINASELISFFTALPTETEQQTIAIFLDRKTTQINTLIAKKQRQIELLREKRAVLISHAVTKGLDSNVKMKDSRIEWLGEIPEEWEIKKLKFVGRLRSGDSITSSDIDEDGNYPVYGGNGLRGYTTSYTHEGEYVLIGRQGALCGCINYAKGRFWASEHAVVVTILKKNNVTWLGELLRSMNLNRYSQSAAQPGLAVENITALSIPVPPVEDQIKISDFLIKKSFQINTLIDKVTRSIGSLREYRTTLISAAVTGKIDVRREVP